MESMTNSRSPVLEIPVDDPATARAAASHADRLEVCRDLEAEGLTPSPEFLAEIVAASREEGYRPEIAVVFQELPPPEDRRIVGPADFRARPEDLRRLSELAPAFAAAGAGSVVLGFADEDGLPDEVAVAEAVRIVAEHGMQLAFHRAFDLADDPAEAARRLEALGVDRTLAAGSSGYDASVVACLLGLGVADPAALLAAALGATETTIYNYLSGRQAWPAIRARFVSLAMGVPLRALLDPKGEGADAAAQWLRGLGASTDIHSLKCDGESS